jgi:hypothetical protein
MDFFLAACQGAGLALAAGALAGAPGRREGVGTFLAVVAVVAGAVLFGVSLGSEDHPSWPGWPLGAALAAFSFFVSSDLAAGAARRAEGAGFVSAVIALAALALAGLSILLPPIGLVALAGLLWLFAGQRRRATQKYEGLRTLR